MGSLLRWLLLAAPACAANFKSIEDLASSVAEAPADEGNNFQAGSKTVASVATSNLLTLPSASQVLPTMRAEEVGTASVTKAEQDAQPYGPDACVRTFKDDSSRTCVLKTSCLGVAGFAEYDMGFRCATESEPATVHLFGAGSFAQEETFDSQIACEQCMPLDDMSREAPADLETQVLAMRHNLASVKRTVGQLQSKVSFSLRGSQEGN